MKSRRHRWSEKLDHVKPTPVLARVGSVRLHNVGNITQHYACLMECRQLVSWPDCQRGASCSLVVLVLSLDYFCKTGHFCKTRLVGSIVTHLTWFLFWYFYFDICEFEYEFFNICYGHVHIVVKWIGLEKVVFWDILSIETSWQHEDTQKIGTYSDASK